MLRTLLTTTAFATLMVGGAIAQDAPATTTDTVEIDATTDAMADGTSTSILASGYTVVDEDKLATELMGMAVYSSVPDEDGEAGEQIGDINNFVIGDDGSVQAVIIGVGGFLGIGEKNVAVNYENIEWATDENGNERLELAATKEELENAPDFETVDQDDMTATDDNMAMDDTMTPADNVAVDNDNAMATDDAMMAPENDTNAMATDDNAMATDDTMATDDNAMATDDTMAADDNAMATDDNMAADDTMSTGPVMQEPVTGPIDRATLTETTMTAEELIGTNAYGPNDEHLGAIGDIVFGEDGTTIEAVVIDFGGFLGIGTKPVAVSIENLQFALDENNNRYLFIDVTRDQLDAAPAFDADTFEAERDQQLLTTGAM